ncbi:unnamed protein product [Closterium sp. NIES-65]|nr:unnamed protein product [Closterium sp. NIES-65]CAI5979978.1 unnamed protein product [Closterium sp. NIES-65]
MGARRETFRWGDAEEEEEGLDSVLPPTQTIGPDEKGIKIVIEWRLNEEGQRVKVTKKIRVKKQLKKLKPEVIRRRSLKKFGDAVGQVGSDNFTMVSTEEIFLERPNQAQSKQDEQAKPSGDLAAIGSASLMVCRICGKKGDHWTSKCPFKDLAAARGLAVGEKFDEDGAAPSAAAGAPSGKTSYVPPSLRAGGAASRAGEDSGGGGRRGGGRDDSNSVRVTNLSEDTREQDLQELFGPFGPVSRIYVAFDRETGLSRGFAFINFINREDAVRAINKLDGADAAPRRGGAKGSSKGSSNTLSLSDAVKASEKAKGAVSYSQDLVTQLKAKADDAIAASATKETEEETALANYDTAADTFATSVSDLPKANFNADRKKALQVRLAEKLKAATARSATAKKYADAVTALDAQVLAASGAAETGSTAAADALTAALDAVDAANAAAKADPSSATRAAAAEKAVAVAVAQKVASGWEVHLATLASLKDASATLSADATKASDDATTEEGTIKTAKETADADLATAIADAATAQQTYDAAKQALNAADAALAQVRTAVNKARASQVDKVKAMRDAVTSLYTKILANIGASKTWVDVTTSATLAGQKDWENRASGKAASDPKALSNMDSIVKGSEKGSSAGDSSGEAV